MAWKNGDVEERGRQDRLIKERIHDPYMTRSKPSEPTVCPECGVVFAGGRWQWMTQTPEDAERSLCPACQRGRDRVPAGYLYLSGDFLAQHRDEILNLVRNKAEGETAQHPMKRLMDIEERVDGGLEITFTDVHLPRGVGDAIRRAYEGELDIQYTDEAGIVRVYWTR
jgi:NMD protein affecting ribosome stability and mRNA decay